MPDDWFGDARTIDQRLRRPLTRGEVFALVLCVAIALLFLWVRIDNGGAYYDLSLYLNASRGEFYTFFYGNWILPLFWLLSFLPIVLSHTLWSLLNIAAVFFAARVFGGNVTFALVSFQMLYSLIYGQITGLIVGSVALMYWAAAHERWYLAGLGLILAVTKYQLGLFPVVAIWLLVDTSWKNRLKMLVVPVMLVASSFLFYGNWVADALARWAVAPSDAQASVALWRWLGFFALGLWLPPLLSRVTRRERFIWILAANALAVPYFQQADLVLLWTMPIGAIALLGNLGYVFFVGRFTALQILAVVPLIVYVRMLAPRAQALFARVSRKQISTMEDSHDRT